MTFASWLCIVCSMLAAPNLPAWAVLPGFLAILLIELRYALVAGCCDATGGAA